MHALAICMGFSFALLCSGLAGLPSAPIQTGDHPNLHRSHPGMACLCSVLQRLPFLCRAGRVSVRFCALLCFSVSCRVRLNPSVPIGPLPTIWPMGPMVGGCRERPASTLRPFFAGHYAVCLPAGARQPPAPAGGGSRPAGAELSDRCSGLSTQAMFCLPTHP